MWSAAPANRPAPPAEAARGSSMRVLIDGVVSEEESPRPDGDNDCFEVARHEADPGRRQPGAVTGGFTDGQPVPIVQGPIIAGIDGGCIRNRHDKTSNFGVIVGQSGAAGHHGRCFGPVRSRDERRGRRLCGTSHAQGPPVPQRPDAPQPGRGHRVEKPAAADRMAASAWRHRHGDIGAWRAALSGAPQE